MLQIGLFFLLWVVAWAPCGILLAAVLGWNPLQPLSPLQKLPFLLSLYFIAPFLLGAFLAWFDLPWLSIGISATNLSSGSFLRGLVVSVLSIVGLFAFFATLDWVTIRNNRGFFSVQESAVHKRSTPSEKESFLLKPTVIVLCFLLLAIIVSGVEELVFRGFLAGQLSEFWPIGVAGVIASLIFALLHLVWEGKANIPQLPGLWVMGMVLTMAWWIDDQAIALAWGLHAGWVWSVATVDALELIEYTYTVPTWVTGIDNKPLAGMMGVIALALTGLGLYFFG